MGNLGTADSYLSIIADNVRRLSGLTDQLTIPEMYQELQLLTNLEMSDRLTIGDYLKGIAVCVRYLNGDPDYITSTNTLEEISNIITSLELGGGTPSIQITLTLSKSLVLDVSGYIDSPDEDVEVILCQVVGPDYMWVQSDSAYPKNKFPYPFDTEYLEDGEYIARVTVRSWEDEYLTFESNIVQYSR